MSQRPPVNFCLRCGTRLELRFWFGQERPCCPVCGYIHFDDPKVAAAVFITAESRVLLIQRGVDPERGKWALPAGYVDGDEDPCQTAVREALEETGLQVRVTGLLDVFHGTHRPGASILIVYAAEVIGGELAPADDAEAAAWFGPDALPELAFESTHRVVGDWARSLRGN